MAKIRLLWVLYMPVQNAEIAAMFDQAAELLEIGGENDLHAYAAKLAGIKLAVSTDAHSIDAFQYMRFGAPGLRRTTC